MKYDKDGNLVEKIVTTTTEVEDYYGHYYGPQWYSGSAVNEVDNKTTFNKYYDTNVAAINGLGKHS